MSLLLFSILLIVPSHSPQATAADSAKAEIVLERTDNVVLVSATFTGTSELNDTLTYRMSVRRVGLNGSSTSRQSGEFASTARKQILSSSSVNIAEGSQLEVRLDIIQADEIIARHSINKTY